MPLDLLTEESADEIANTLSVLERYTRHGEMGTEWSSWEFYKRRKKLLAADTSARRRAAFEESVEYFLENVHDNVLARWLGIRPRDPDRLHRLAEFRSDPAAAAVAAQHTVLDHLLTISGIEEAAWKARAAAGRRRRFTGGTMPAGQWAAGTPRADSYGCTAGGARCQELAVELIDDNLLKRRRGWPEHRWPKPVLDRERVKECGLRRVLRAASARLYPKLADPEFLERRIERRLQMRAVGEGDGVAAAVAAIGPSCYVQRRHGRLPPREPSLSALCHSFPATACSLQARSYSDDGQLRRTRPRRVLEHHLRRARRTGQRPTPPLPSA